MVFQIALLLSLPSLFGAALQINNPTTCKVHSMITRPASSFVAQILLALALAPLAYVLLRYDVLRSAHRRGGTGTSIQSFDSLAASGRSVGFTSDFEQHGRLSQGLSEGGIIEGAGSGCTHNSMILQDLIKRNVDARAGTGDSPMERMLEMDGPWPDSLNNFTD